MSPQIPAERMHLRMEGCPQEISVDAAMVLTIALDFCGQPETFPAFREFARAGAASMSGDERGYAMHLAEKLAPVLLAGIRVMIAAGAIADLDGAP